MVWHNLRYLEHVYDIGLSQANLCMNHLKTLNQDRGILDEDNRTSCEKSLKLPLDKYLEEWDNSQNY